MKPVPPSRNKKTATAWPKQTAHSHTLLVVNSDYQKEFPKREFFFYDKIA
jgi:hypothetical protein